MGVVSLTHIPPYIKISQVWPFSLCELGQGILEMIHMTPGSSIDIINDVFKFIVIEVIYLTRKIAAFGSISLAL